MKLNISVAVLGGLSCLFMLVNVPVWALFIGWSWYFTLGAKPELIKGSIPPILVGSGLAALAFILIDVLSATGMDSVFSLASTIISVIITVFLLMLTLQVPALSQSTISFNAYSCMFIGYAASAYLPVGGMPALLNAFIWVTVANFIGVLFGWLSIKLAG